MDRKRLAMDCLKIERAGGSVREYLASRGCISPWGTWFRLQLEELGRKRCEITDGKGDAEMRKLTLADKKKAVDIALNGGNPVAFLKELGSKNPSAHWSVIKKNLKETNPEIYEKLTGKKDEEDRLKAAAQETVQEIMARVENQDEPNMDAAIDEDFRIYGVNTRVGDFQTDAGFLCWSPEGREQVNLPVGTWKTLIEVVPKVMKVMRLA